MAEVYQCLLSIFIKPGIKVILSAFIYFPVVRQCYLAVDVSFLLIELNFRAKVTESNSITHFSLMM